MTSSRTGRIRIRLVVCALALALVAGCASVTGTPSMEEAPGTGASAPSYGDPAVEATQPCIIEGFPCSLAEVPFTVVEASATLGSEAAGMAQIDGDTAGARELVRGHPDIVDVQVTDEAITFRLDGGVPIMVFTSPTVGSAVEVEGAADLEWPASMGDGGAETPDGGAIDAAEDPPGLRATASAFAAEPQRALPREYQPAGESGQNHDDGPARKAVVIEPYGSMSTFASGNNYANIMERQGAVDSVDHVRDTSVHAHPNIFDVMTTLDQYELIHISSHGWAGGVIGPRITEEWYTPADADGNRSMVVEVPKNLTTIVTCFEDKIGEYATPAFITDAIGEVWGRGAQRCEIRFAFGQAFFSTYYPSGLQQSLVVADWCQSTTDDALRKAIAGAKGGGYVGWSDTVHPTTTALASAWLWQYLSTGADPLTVIARLHDEGRAVDRWLPQHAELESTGSDFRVRDAVTSFTAGGQRIAAHVPLEWSGIADDGAGDTLDEISLTVAAVPAGQLGKLQVKIWIDDELLPVTVADFDAVPESSATDYWQMWTLTAEDLPLPFDVTPDRLGEANAMPWRVEVSDGGIGPSTHKVSSVYLRGAGIDVSHPTALTRLAGNGDRIDIDDIEDDGRPDNAPVLITVHQVPPELVDAYQVLVTVTGGTLRDARTFTWPLADFEAVGENTYRKRATIALDHDLTDTNRPLTIDAQLQRNGEAIDSHQPTVNLYGRQVSQCLADVTIRGTVMHAIQASPSSSIEYRPYPVDLSEHMEFPLGLSLASFDDYEATALNFTNKGWQTEITAADLFDLYAENFGRSVPAGETGTFTIEADVAYRDFSNVRRAVLIAQGKPLPDEGWGEPEDALTTMTGELTLVITTNKIDGHVLANHGETTIGELAGSLSGTFTDAALGGHGSQVTLEGTFEYSSTC